MLYVWIAVLIAAVVVEALTNDFVAIWFFPASLVSMILSLFDTPPWLQLLLFLVVGLALVIAGYVIGGVKANANRQKIQTVSAVPVPAYVEQVAQIQPTVSPWQRETNQDTATEETQ